MSTLLYPEAVVPEEERTDVNKARQGLYRAEELGYSKLPPLPDTIEEFWTNITLSDSWQSRALVVRPKSATSDLFGWSPRVTSSRSPKRPLIIHFHGGGFTVGTPLHLSHPARLFAQRFNATVICPSYRLAPEHPWPAAMKDGLEIVQLISSQSELQFGANLSQGFIVGGASAGGAIAGVVAGLTSNNPTRYPLLRPLTGAFISIAMLLVDSIVPPEYKALWTSRDDNRDAEILSSAGADEVIEQMGCKNDDLVSPWFSPVNLFTGKESGDAKYPPTYLQGAGLDSIRDDPVVFEKVLAAHGVPTKIDIFSDDPHNTLSTFNMIFPPQSTNPTIEEYTLAGIDWLLTFARNGNGNGNGHSH